MEKILNETPIKTTNNFKINDIKVNLDINKTEFNDYEITNLEYNKSIKDNFNSKINLEDDKYLNIDININNDINDSMIKYEFTKDNTYLVSNININLKENTSSNIIILYKSEYPSFNNTKLIINANKNSISNISIINLLNNYSKSLISIENYEEEYSNININYIDITGNLRISNYYSKLIGNYSKNNFNNIYIGVDNDRIDMNYLIENIGKNTTCKIVSNGCLNNTSNKSFKGTIDFKEGSSKSKGDEEEKCILLSDACISRSLPMLLCHEEDVNGSHGVSTGKIDQNKLFYLTSKGIDEKDAKKLIIKANFNDIIENITNEVTKKLVNEVIDQKLRG